MIGNPYPQNQNVQEWNDFVNEVRNAMTKMGTSIAKLYEAIASGDGGYVLPDATATQKGVMKLYPTGGNNTDGTITQRALTVSQQEQDEQIAAIYATQTGMSDAISNATKNAVSMIELAITIPQTDWMESTLTEYPYTRTIANDKITADMMPLFEPTAVSMLVAEACGLAPICETVDGGLVVYSVEVPAASIAGTLRLSAINNAA